MDDQERASLDLPKRVEIYKPPVDPPADSEPPLRWPKWTWPVGVLVRDLPIVLAIVLLAEGFVRAGAWLGSAYFQAVSIEERAAYRVCAYLVFILAVSLARALGWIFRPARTNAGWQLSCQERTRKGIRLLFLPCFWAVALVWITLRYLGLLLVGAAAVFLGVGLPVMPESPDSLRTVSLALLFLTGVGAGVLGLRLGWQARTRSRIGPAFRAAGWLAAAVFLIAGSVHLLAAGARLVQLNTRLRTAAPVEKAERLAQALHDPFELTRAYAARGLGEVAPFAQGAVPGLVAALDDESAEVRVNAARSLCEIRDPQAMTPLLDAADRRRLLFGTADLNSRLRWDVLRGIKSFGYAAQLEVLNGPNPVHRTLILRGALNNYEPLPAEILLRACGSTYRDERQAAFQVLEKGEHRDAEVLAAMLAHLKGPDPERAALAARVLGAMGETAEPAVPALIACVVGPEARLKGPASEALIRLGASARKPVEAARLNAPPEARPLFESILRGMEPLGKKSGGLPAEALPQQAEAIPGFDLEIRLLYDGRPLDWCALDVKPVVRVYLFETRNWVNAEPDGAGRLIAKDAQPGRCSVSVRIDAIPDQPKEDSGPGDYVGDANAVLERGENAPVEVPLRRILHLTSPADSREVLKGGSMHAGPVRFAWDPLGEGVRYDVTIRGTMPSSWTQKATTQPFIDLDLGPGDFCIEVYARRGKELLGTLNILRDVEYEMLGKKRTRVVSHRWYQYRAMPLESGPITVTGQLAYGGKPFDARGRGVTPVLVVQDLLNNKPYEGKVELDGDVYRLPKIPSGVYEVRVTVDAEPSNPPGFPGDYFGKVSFGAREGRTPDATVRLLKVMRLLKPEDSARGVVFYPGAKMPPRVPTPVTFAWESLGEGVTYSYYVNPSGKRGQTKDCSVTLDLPADGTTYNFTLYGYASTGRLGELTFDGEHYRTSYPLQTGD